MRQIPALQQFLKHMKYTHRSPQTTIDNYNYIIVGFFQFKSKGHGFNPPPVQKITKSMIDGFIEYMNTKANRNNGYSIASQSSRLGCLKSFFDHCVEFGYISVSPMEHVHFPKVPDSERIDLDISDYDAIVDKAKCFRDRVLFEFLLFQGMRVQEVVNCNIDYVPGTKAPYIKWDEKEVYILGEVSKGKKERTIPILDHVLEDLREYLNNHRKPAGNTEKALFLTKGGTRLLKRSIQDIVRIARKAAELPKQITCHSFRRAFARLLYERGFQIAEIQVLLGHKNIETTMKYINVKKGFIKQRYESASMQLIDDIEKYRKNNSVIPEISA